MKKTSLLILILSAIIAMQCGGSSGSTENRVVNIGAGNINTGNIQPKPIARAKWVYNHNKFNLDTRIVFEITSLNGISWTRVQINEGIIVDQRTFNFQIHNDLTYFTQVETGSAFFSYEGLGRRAWLSQSEYPFSETLKVASLSASGISSFTQRRDYNLLKNEQLSLSTGLTDTIHTQIITSINNIENNFEVRDTREQWLNDSYGMVKETFVENDIPVEMTLVSYNENANEDISINGLQITSTKNNLILEKSATIPEKTPDAFFREIHKLASQYPENTSKVKMSVSLAQNSHLFHRYYINSSHLPSDLSSIDNAQAYVEHISKNDPFSFYFSPDSFTNFVGSISGETSIIGLQMTHIDGTALNNDTILNEGELKISRVIPLSRGWNDGIIDNDIILTINGNTIAGKKFSEIKDLLPKSESQTVNLGLSRNGSSININTASENHISKMLSNNIAYINIRKFTENTGTEVQKDIEELITNNTTPAGMIMDLRYNTGGSAQGTRVLLDYMIDADTPTNTHIIYSVKNSDEKYYMGAYSDDHMFELAQDKLVILMNDSSASASELTAGALKQYKNALLLGDKSFGKGVSQTIRKLIDGSGVAITFQELAIAGNISYHGIGISPDISYTTEPGSLSDDTQLNAAIEYIHTGKINGLTKPDQRKFKKPEFDIEFKDLNLTL
jgi:C-terminal peptidase prc